MKIIRLSTYLDYGGLERRLANISHVEDNNEWVFVCFDKRGNAAKIIESNQKRVVNLNISPKIFSYKTLQNLVQFLRKEKPDVLHTSGAEANFHGIIAGKIVGIPKIIGEEIGIPQHSTMARIIFSSLYKLTDYVVGNSQLVLDAVHQLDKVPYSKLVKIDNPLIFSHLNNKKQHSDKCFQMVMISRLEKVKNIKGVLAAFSRLYKENINVCLKIAGTGSEEIFLKNLIEELDLQNVVEMLGYVTDPYPLLLQSDLYILNSHSEGFSNSLAEAMYSGTPSLSSKVGAAEEMIKDGINGFLVKPADEEDLYQKLKEIINMSKYQLEQIGNAGHEKIVNNYSLEHHIQELIKIYQ
ncbi:Probable poly(glycerol-phosphate) alpha-glucosyltransferase [Candidatus Ornithobacterium hominis]|uniref:glycosyltransferase n=1 Tax=Candidatus Ornithobacterium hominis TaxID=2497989 RepID=UPI000E5AEFF8|nr:glycosyltransferase [Candidatus Ornithobacterium hominis]SZD72071.1 Probable poly(glycerol-phosphate) alpha-glucosyltransferase [Candidatus Ornithobacterium hominis]